ncbi:MAG TPA: M2 family metallopeptidase, partial [Allosphingosinicella sp.]|nr:M2 family metallopeptidase [Allosphingosinicella sp.]
MKSSVSRLALAFSASLAAACTTAAAGTDDSAAAAPPATAAQERGAALTAADADAFVTRAEHELGEFAVLNSRAQWVNATYITPDTDALAAHFGTIGTEMGVRYATEAARYLEIPGLSDDTRRKLNILRSGLTLPAPTTAGAAAELNRISTDLSSQYGRGRGTMNGEQLTGNEIEARMGTVRNPAQLQEMWTSWNNNVGSPMRQDYARMVEIANAGARELGFEDTGAMWRSKYDMSPQEFEALTERLWQEVQPLYQELHCFVRAGLNRRYGNSVQP